MMINYDSPDTLSRKKCLCKKYEKIINNSYFLSEVSGVVNILHII